MPKLIAVDLGSHSVKLAVYEGAFGRFQLEGLLSAPVPQDPQADDDLAGAISPSGLDAPSTEEETEASEPASLAPRSSVVGVPPRLVALRRLLAGLGELQRPVFVAGWPTERASIRHISLPFSDKAQVEKVLPFEVEGQVPFDMEDMELRHRVLQIEPGDSQVLVAVIERDGLSEHIAALHEAGADPKSLEIDADLLAELAPEVGVHAVIDIGHQRILVTLVRDGRAVAARALDGGGRALTLALADAFELDWSDAEARKHVASLDESAAPVQVETEWETDETTQTHADAPPAPRNLRPLRPAAGRKSDATVLRDAFLPQLAELRSTLISFEDGVGVDITSIVLTGGGSALGGLADLLHRSFGVPVVRADLGDDAAVQACPDAWGLVCAMGDRGSRGKAGSMELRQGKLAFKGDLFIVRQVGLYAGVFAACALLAGTAMFAVRTVQLNSQISDVETEVASLVTDAFDDIPAGRIKSSTDALAIATEKSLEATSRVDTLGEIVADQPPTASLLRDLSIAMPPPDQARVDVRILSLNSSTITLDAETDGFEAVGRIESALQQNPRFAGARKGNEDKRRTGEVRFKITIPRNAEGDGEEG
ncbi:MAG: pilus assembly protein PilM [Alphaproteobacteria bacterium]|nr:pilus assembly protein PilM [Alphaproteobacteria bacterium]